MVMNLQYCTCTLLVYRSPSSKPNQGDFVFPAIAMSDFTGQALCRQVRLLKLQDCPIAITLKTAPPPLIETLCYLVWYVLLCLLPPLLRPPKLWLRSKSITNILRSSQLVMQPSPPQGLTQLPFVVMPEDERPTTAKGKGLSPRDLRRSSVVSRLIQVQTLST